MYIVNRHFNNRAVSQIIAALLLIAIAVAAAILLYVFSIGLLGSLGSGGGQQTKEQLILEAYNWGGTTITGSFRNVGPANINIAGSDAFVNGLSAVLVVGSSTITPQQSTLFTITPSGSSYTSGAAYTLKIVTPDGGVFSYSVVDGSAS
jgi:flagellin-like protein